VRRQVLSGINGFYRDSAFQRALNVVDEEKNPDIRAAAITALGGYSKPEVREKLLAFLKAESYRNVLADAAITAIRSQGDSAYIQPLHAVLKEHEDRFETGGFARGLDTLAALARDEDNKDAVRTFLLDYVNSSRRRVQLAAINGLGTLGDTKAIGVLEKFTTLPEKSPERSAAEKAIAALRDSKRPSAELGAIRTEVLGLQKENRELRKELDDVKKRIESLAPKPLTTKTNKTARPPRPTKR
jgi:HEAT repeat protein